MPLPRCSQCGHEVQPVNDAIIIDAKVHMAPEPTEKEPRCHFLPVYYADTGEKICEGSPGSAQYIYDRPRDPRTTYLPQFEPKYRAAYKCVIAEHQARTHPFDSSRFRRAVR